MRRPNPFEYGLIAKNNLDFNGQPFFDSYDSRTWPFDYSFGVNSGQEVTVGSISSDISNLDLGNATILGDISTGASNDGTDLRGGATISGDIIWDFNMDFPTITAPAGHTSWSPLP
jgi:hypothetical protein